MKTTLIIVGTYCKACKMLLEDVGREVSGVVDIIVDYTTGVTEVEHKSLENLHELKKSIEELGEYHVKNI